MYDFDLAKILLRFASFEILFTLWLHWRSENLSTFKLRGTKGEHAVRVWSMFVYRNFCDNKVRQPKIRYQTQAFFIHENVYFLQSMLCFKINHRSISDRVDVVGAHYSYVIRYTLRSYVKTRTNCIARTAITQTAWVI